MIRTEVIKKPGKFPGPFRFGGGETHSELLIGVESRFQVYGLLLIERRKLMGLPCDGTSTVEKQRGYAP